MKRKWLLVMISIMTAIVLAACGTSDKKRAVQVMLELTKKKAAVNSELEWRLATRRSTGHSKTMRMAL